MKSEQRFPKLEKLLWLPDRRSKSGLITSHYLFADTNVSLANKNARMMNGLGQSKLEDLGLQTSYQEILDFEAQNVIQQRRKSFLEFGNLFLSLTCKAKEK